MEPQPLAASVKRHMGDRLGSGKPANSGLPLGSVKSSFPKQETWEPAEPVH